MSTTPRILHVASRLDGYGAARMLRYLIARQISRGADVTLLAQSADAAIASELQSVGASVRVFRSRWPLDPIALVRMTRACQRSAADVIHFWGIGSLPAAMISSRDAKNRVFASVSASDVDHPWFKRLIHSFQHKVDQFIVETNPTVAQLVNLGVDGARVATIRRGASPPAPARLSRERWLAELDLPPDSQLIAVVGPLERRKQFDEAIWSYELVRVVHPQARLVIFGDGPDRARLERFATLVSEPGCVRFVGFQPEVASYLPHVDVYWQLSPASSTPHSLLEAMSASLPTVASDVPAHRAAIEHQRTGFLAPLGSRAEVTRATDLLLQNPVLRSEVGVAAATSINAQWRLDAALDAYESLHERVQAARTLKH